MKDNLKFKETKGIKIDVAIAEVIAGKYPHFSLTSIANHLLFLLAQGKISLEGNEEFMRHLPRMSIEGQ